MHVGGSGTIEGETTGKTGDRTKKGLEGLRKMMRDVVLVDLDHGPPRAFFIGELGFTANANDSGVIRT